MNYKKTFLFIIVLIWMVSPLWSAERWRIRVAPFDTIGKAPSIDIADMMRKSLITALEKIKDFEIRPTVAPTNRLESRENALALGRKEKADVLVYGNYYSRNKKLYFYIEVLDVLHDRIKLRKFYTGDLSLDIFDTVDAITGDVTKNIRASLPKITAESEVEIKKIRKVLYERQAVTLKRQFQTILSVNMEMGYKDMSRVTSSFQATVLSTSPYPFDRFPTLNTEIGFMIRIWDVRMDFLIGSSPAFQFVNQNPVREIPTMSSFHLSYFPAFFAGGRFGIGFGMIDFPVKLHFGLWDGEYQFDVVSPITRALFFSWLPSLSLELSVGVKLKWHYQDDPNQDSRGHGDYMSYDLTIPGTLWTARWFISDVFGLNFRFYYESGEYTQGHYQDNTGVLGELNSTGYAETLSFSFGVIYRANFM